MIGPKVIGLMMMVVASMASAEMKIVVLTQREQFWEATRQKFW